MTYMPVVTMRARVAMGSLDMRRIMAEMITQGYTAGIRRASHFQVFVLVRVVRVRTVYARMFHALR